MMPKARHGNAAAVAMHHARGEKLCTYCEEWVQQVQNESFRASPIVTVERIDVVVGFAPSLFWKLQDAADALEVKIEDLVIAYVIQGIEKKSRPSKITFDQERQIREAWRAGTTIAETARTVGVSAKTVRHRFEKWSADGIPRSGQSQRTRAADEKENTDGKS